MPSYKVTFDDFESGVSDAYKTAVAVIANDDDQARFRITSVTVGPSDNTPPDANLSVVLHRIADVSGGTAGTAAATIASGAIQRANVNSQDPLASAKTEYSAEPTVYESEVLYIMDFNAHAGLPREFDRRNAPVINRDQHIAIRVASRTGTAIRCSGTIEFEPI